MCPTERNNQRSSDDTNGLVARVAALLSAFTIRDRALSGAELARRTGLARSTTHRIVSDLVAAGLFERTNAGMYQLGMPLFELGLRAPGQRGLRDVANPFLIDLRDATRETVHLAVLDGSDVVYLDIIRASAPPALRSRVGGRVPAHVTAVGKAILAFSLPEAVTAVINTGLPALTRRSITDEAALRVELDAVRRTRTAYDQEEQAPGTSCCASPVFGPGGVVLGAVSVSGHTSTLRVDRVAPAVRATALSISRMHGAGH